MKEYRLNIDARILELLGPNLYTNIYYVLAELIANAYDADAGNVYIIIKENEIRVEDDGHGMSYESGEVERYLNVAGVSRSSEEDAFTRSGRRRKMGRKGVGKLAALSVSAEVDVLTISQGEKSGFVLARQPGENNELRAIDDADVSFERVNDNGSAIVMRNPEYSLHKTVNAIQRNLLRIFPLINADFRVHIIRDNTEVLVEDFDRSVMSELSALITLGDRFGELTDLVPVAFEGHEELVEAREEKAISVSVIASDGSVGEYNLEILGWIGTYRSTRGRKLEMTDFPDNFISLFANEKLGEFNILPAVGQNKLGEVYVVGQLHVDLFELSELPDMALSNRQGYRSDDPRYEAVLNFVRNELLPGILRKRDTYSDLVKAERDKKKLEKQREDERRLREMMDSFRDDASRDAAQALFDSGQFKTLEEIKQAVYDSLNAHSPDIGLKTIVDAQKKRILVSQTSKDKTLSDVIFQMLLFNNVPPEDILYTNCDDEICRVPEGVGVYDYLRDFFVDSYSTEKIYVLFVTSDNTRESWGAVTEVGASWITQIDHKVFNIAPFRPEHPLDDSVQWHTTNRDEDDGGNLWMSGVEADVFCKKIETICDALGYRKQSRDRNRSYLETLIAVRT